MMAQSHEEGTGFSLIFHFFIWIRISSSKVIPHFQFVLYEFSVASAEHHQYGMIMC